MVYTFPSDYGTGCSFLICIDASLIPLVSGALKHFENRRSWHTDEEHAQAYTAFAEIQLQMIRLCAEELIESNNRIYRLLDAGLYGRQYSATSEEPPTITPEIPVVPDPSASIPGLVRRMERLEELLDNALNGITTESFPRPAGIRDKLQELIDTVRATGQLDDDVLAKLSEIALLLA